MLSRYCGPFVSGEATGVRRQSAKNNLILVSISNRLEPTLSVAGVDITDVFWLGISRNCHSDLFIDWGMNSQIILLMLIFVYAKSVSRVLTAQSLTQDAAHDDDDESAALLIGTVTLPTFL